MLPVGDIMRRLAVTGGIACGKSAVGSIVADHGIPVCDADDLAREAMTAETPVWREVLRVFGDGVLGAAGQIDRGALGDIVFSDAGKLHALNSIVHPAVKKAWQAWLDARGDAAAAVVIVPLLYEIGEDKGWDAVVCVSARESDQRQRLRMRGLTENQIGARLAAQMPVLEKATRADHVIFNCGTMDLLREQTSRVLRSALER